ncbi:MAG: 16S rRNA (guanine(527)-N(7))-methyltransferase RsmG [Alphaproteobacteria bacterium]|nr:16S rRNA (guanine(527)-N(7))-methyltransferase RsmG [Alphaproteobacteria bacterium]
MGDSEESAFRQLFVVPHETIHRLNTYKDLLITWNEKFNLVAKSTLPHIWLRHFTDSAQLMAYIPDTALTLADMGAGAGFPGLVLAIMAQDLKKPLHVHSIEATNKKADFLQSVVDELHLPVTIHRKRIEDIRDLKADVITARALKALPDLLVYANYLTHKDSICIFPKGQNAAEELTQARKYWTFAADTHTSRSDDTGSILVLSSLRYKTRR